MFSKIIGNFHLFLKKFDGFARKYSKIMLKYKNTGGENDNWRS